MNIDQEIAPTRQAAINGLAVVGLIALITLGVWLAVYSTQYVPAVATRLGTAAAYLGSLLTPSPKGDLTVVPTPPATTTIPFGNATSTDSSAPAAPKPVPPAGEVKPPKTSVVGSDVGAPAPSVPLYGFPDLAVLVSARGYLAIDGKQDSFVGSATVPKGKQPAVQFTVENRGTNISGPWQITTDPRLASSAQTQPSLAPNSRVSYVIYLDRTNKSTQSLTITVSDNLKESDTSNNSISLTFALD